MPNATTTQAPPERNGEVRRIFMVLGFLLTLLLAFGAAVSYVQSCDQKIREEMRTSAATKEGMELIARQLTDLKVEMRVLRDEQRRDYLALNEKIDRLVK